MIGGARCLWRRLGRAGAEEQNQRRPAAALCAGGPRRELQGAGGSRRGATCCCLPSRLVFIFAAKSNPISHLIDNSTREWDNNSEPQQQHLARCKVAARGQHLASIHSRRFQGFLFSPAANRPIDLHRPTRQPHYSPPNPLHEFIGAGRRLLWRPERPAWARFRRQVPRRAGALTPAGRAGCENWARVLQKLVRPQTPGALGRGARNLQRGAPTLSATICLRLCALMDGIIDRAHVDN